MTKAIGMLVALVMLAGCGGSEPHWVDCSCLRLDKAGGVEILPPWTGRVDAEDPKATLERACSSATVHCDCACGP